MNLSELRARNSGFTMVELLAAIFITAILMAGLYSVFVSQQMAFSAQERIAEMNQNLRAVMDLMTREIRLAGYKKSGAIFNGIATGQPSTIRILADLDQNGDTLGTNEDITYSYDAGTMQIWRNTTGLPVADNITSLTFVYTLADGTTTNTPADLAAIRKVTISITARTAYPDQATGQYRTLTLTSDVTPRNLAS
jgi:prepilin-type N-terminal cleavage/methylation domain-containing protein